jgi:cholesterol transport system auxiliary component
MTPAPGQDRKGRTLMARLNRIMLATGLAAALAGCISLGGKTPESLLTLTATAAPEAGYTAQGSSETAIAVLEPGAPQKLDVNRVPVQVDDTNIAYVQDAVWVEKPARLFQRLMAETIRSRTRRLVLDSADPASGTAVQLQGTLREFGYDARTGSVVVRFDAMLGGEGDSVRTRRFESVVPGVAAEAGPVGDALNRAANDVAGQVAGWLSGG